MHVVVHIHMLVCMSVRERYLHVQKDLRAVISLRAWITCAFHFQTYFEESSTREHPHLQTFMY